MPLDAAAKVESIGTLNLGIRSAFQRATAYRTFHVRLNVAGVKPAPVARIVTLMRALAALSVSTLTEPGPFLIFTVMNPLVDGNKRLGLAATIAFLGVNGRQR
jgi:hypothetical protein